MNEITPPRQTEAESIARISTAGAFPRQALDSSFQFAVLNSGQRIEDLEYMLKAPTEKRGRYVLRDEKGFVRFINLHKTANTHVFFNLDGGLSAVAVIDDHGETTPGWRRFTAEMKAGYSHERRAWYGKNKSSFSQVEFATFLESNVGDIASAEGFPTGADVLKMALGFEATSEMKLMSKTNLQNGEVRLQYSDAEDERTRQAMSVFERFKIAIPFFENDENRYPIEARLKYRISNGKAAFYYELVREDKAERQAIQDTIARIESATQVAAFYGEADLCPPAQSESNK